MHHFAAQQHFVVSESMYLKVLAFLLEFSHSVILYKYMSLFKNHLGVIFCIHCANYSLKKAHIGI